MARGGRRSKESFRRFVEHLDESGVVEEVLAIGERHGATLLDLYAERSREAIAARLEAWHWLTTETGRSAGEVAVLFDRSSAEVFEAMARLDERAEMLGVRAVSDTVPTLAKLVSEELAPGAGRAIKRS